MPDHHVPFRRHWRKTWRAPNLGIVDEPMFVSLLKYRAAEDRRAAAPGDANLVSSHVLGTRFQAPIIDLDYRHQYIPSTTAEHAHLYLDVNISKWRWVALMIGLWLGKAIEPGNFWWSMRRGANYVRLPGVRKTDAERVTYTHGMFRLLPEFRKGRRG